MMLLLLLPLSISHKGACVRTYTWVHARSVLEKAPASLSRGVWMATNSWVAGFWGGGWTRGNGEPESLKQVENARDNSSPLPPYILLIFHPLPFQQVVPMQLFVEAACVRLWTTNVVQKWKCLKPTGGKAVWSPNKFFSRPESKKGSRGNCVHMAHPCPLSIKLLL